VQIPQGLGEGLWICADPRFEFHLLGRAYEPQMQDLLRAHLKPGGCFYDLGAHIGLFSLIAARIVGESGLVVAFEPDHENAAVVRASGERNGMPQLRVVEAAVWSASDPLEFVVADARSGRVDGQVARISVLPSRRITVPAFSLDDFIFRDKERPPDFLKIDVEAAESEVLRGATELFSTHKPQVLCEVHNAANKNSVEAWLLQRNYSLRWVNGQNPFPVHVFASTRPI